MMNLSTTNGFAAASYQRHVDHWAAMARSSEWERFFRSWLDETSADFWRHRRMYEAASCLAAFGETSWLTIGDGQFGLDSVRLMKRGAKTALPTDIADPMLAEGKARGIIADYRVENAERLSFTDGAFDFAFCKEAYHHFPRPFLALYEMLRVSRLGVVLIEPQDQIGSLVKQAIFLAKKALGRQRHFDTTRYEDSGNYIYSVSKRELTKVCLGLDLPTIAFKGLSDFYIPGVEFTPASFASLKFLLMRGVVLTHDILSALGLARHNVLMSCLFKVDPPAEVRTRFVDAGWRVIDLPKNPYIAERGYVPRPPV